MDAWKRHNAATTQPAANRHTGKRNTNVSTFDVAVIMTI